MSSKWRKRRGDMTPEELAVARRQASHRDAMHKLGRPLNVPAQPVLDYVALLESMGMSKGSIAEAAGLHVSTVVSAATRPPNKVHPRTMRRITADKIMAVQFTAPTGIDGPGSLGAKMPAHGVTRRIQALVAHGYPYLFLARELGYGTRVECVRQFATRPQYKWAHYLTLERIKKLYDRLQYDKPAEHGVTAYGSSRARVAAFDWDGRPFAPPGCWDDDTIDDPDAEPEWTGACGSAKGYRIHLREDIPVCPPCREAYSRERTDGRRPIPPANIARVRLDHNLTRTELGDMLGVDSGLIRNWETGRSRPRAPMVDVLCDVLEIDAEILFEAER